VTQHRIPTFSDAIPNALSSYSRFTLDWPALYTANHPPLFYVLSWPAWELSGDTWGAKLYAVRLVSIPLFLATVWLSYRLALALAPGDPFLLLGVPAVIAFQPQLSFEGAIVNNDMLAIMLGTLLLYLCVLTVRQGLTLRRSLALGLTVGLGLLSKATLTALVPVVAAAAIYACWPRPWARVRTARYWRPLLARAALVVTPAVLLPLPWYLFLRHTYGDFTAFRALDMLQASWGPPNGTFFGLLFSPSFHLERLRESWGDWGWKLIPLTGLQADVLYAGAVLVALGLLLRLVQLARARRRNEPWPAPGRLAAAGVLAGAVVLLYGAMIYFGTKNPLTQARYVFPAFAAGAALALLGLRGLIPSCRRAQAGALVVALAAGFNLLLLVQSVLPYALRR
jgi:4-amino-4-deoxy-L-arabinose transferase-like glycosyltransferase